MRGRPGSLRSVTSCPLLPPSSLTSSEHHQKAKGLRMICQDPAANNHEGSALPLQIRAPKKYKDEVAQSTLSELK